tara:strand:- start:436 stop:714 length:279 start_codon:yes stop_codon:yes gene_type:complete
VKEEEEEKKEQKFHYGTAKNYLHDTTAERSTRKRASERASERKWILGRRVRSRHRHRLRGRTQVESREKNTKEFDLKQPKQHQTPTLICWWW